MTNMTRTKKMLGGAMALALAIPAFSAAQDEDRNVAVHVGRLITGAGEEQENVTILMINGKIEAIGEKVELPFPCDEVDARHLTAMPGLIHPNSRLGMLSFSRSGVRSHLRVADEFLPPEDAYDDALAAGYTTIALAPPGTSGLPGRAMVIRGADVGDGWILQEESYVKLNLRSPGNDKKTMKKAFDDAQKEIDKVKKAREEWEKKQKEAAEAAKKKAEEEAKKKEQQEKEKKENGGKAYNDEPPKPKADDKKPEEKKKEEFKPPAIKPELQPLVDMLEGKDGVFGLAEIGNASTYLHIKDALRKHDIPVMLMANTRQAGSFGRQDLFFVAEEMGENEETAIIYPGIVNYPYSINKVNLPKKLADAGVQIAFGPFSDNKAALESMRYQVGEVIKGGLSRETAVQAMTLNVAKALGLDDRLGSVEKGKDGNLLLLSGDPFDVQTRVEKVMIEGNVAYDRDEDED